jgi:hypothetical protein
MNILDKIPKKKKVKSLESFNKSRRLPKTLYHHTVKVLKIYKNRKTGCFRDLLPLRKVITGLIHRGKITCHGHNCLVSLNLEYLQRYFKYHSEKLLVLDNPQYRYLAKIYYKIKNLIR